MSTSEEQVEGRIEVGSAQEEQASPEEIASQLLYLYTPVYQNLVKGLSQKAMRRLLLKLIEFPFNDKAYEATSPAEGQVFEIGKRLLEAKYLLIMQTYAQNIDQMQVMAQQEKEKQNGE